MLLDIVIISIIIGLIRKGTLKGELKLNYAWIVPLAFLVQVLGTWLLPQFLKPLAVIASYLGLLIFAGLNFRKQYIKFIALGIFLNFLVITLNGGMMPVDLDAAVSVGYDVTPLETGTVFKQQALTASTVLGFFGDIIPLKYPIPRVISIGDVSIFLGVFLLLQDFMGRPLNIFNFPGIKLKKS